MADRSARRGQTVTRSFVLGDVIYVDGNNNTVLRTHRRPFRAERCQSEALKISVQQARNQPGRLLLARHQAVPFVGRADDLANLNDWIDSRKAIDVRLLYASGGAGKTRLATQLAASRSAANWAVCQIWHISAASADARYPAVRVDLPSPGALIIVDYADRWPAIHISELIADLNDLNVGSGFKIRILLLARSAGSWWPALSSALSSTYGIEASASRLTPVDSQIDRVEMFRQARHSFAAATQISGTEDLPMPPCLRTDESFSQILAVHMAALVAVDAHRRGSAVPAEPHALSAYLLERERAHWYELHARAEDRRPTTPENMGRAVFVATLIGPAPVDVARNALQCAMLAEPSINTVIDDHRFCYPPRDPSTVLEGLLPDRLGEDLIGLTVPGHQQTGVDLWQSDPFASTMAQDLLAADGAAAIWAPSAITVLVETARRWRNIATEVLYPLLQQQPELAFSAGGATLARLAELPDIGLALLENIEQRLPARRHIDLDIGAAAVVEAIARQRLNADTDPAERAFMQYNLATRLLFAGRHQEAVAPAEGAAEVYRHLAAEDPATYEAIFARALAQLGALRIELGRYEEALAPTEEAAAVFEQLAGADTAHAADFATALSNIGNVLARGGRHDEALKRMEHAVQIRLGLDRGNSSHGQLPDLAISVTQLVTQLGRMDRSGEALPVTEAAVAIARGLADADPATHLPILARSLAIQGTILSHAGRRAEALSVAQEALGLHRGLADLNPALYLPELAGSLNNVGNRSWELGQRDDAVALIGEASRLYRELADARPAVHEPELARSLANLGSKMLSIGHHDDGLRLIEEAITIGRGLAEANPTAYESDLASFLTALGSDLSMLGRFDEALPPTAEALAIIRRRCLADVDPAAEFPSLAAALIDLSNLMSGLGRHTEALSLSQEATVLYRKLADTNPTSHLPNLANSLNKVGVSLWNRGRLDEAMSPTEEAITIYRQLAAGESTTHLRDLAALLTNLGTYMAQFGLHDEARLRLEEAVAIRRRLVDADPGPHLHGLAASLLNLGSTMTNMASPEEGLRLTSEAVEIGRRLAEDDPDAHLPNLATSLSSLSVQFSIAGRLEAAVQFAEEAVATARDLAAANPEAHMPKLAASLHNLGAALWGVQRREEAVEATSEAVGIRLKLASVSPAHLPGFNESLRNLRGQLSQLGRHDGS